jgi:hypothetical protein
VVNAARSPGPIGEASLVLLGWGGTGFGSSSPQQGPCKYMYASHQEYQSENICALPSDPATYPHLEQMIDWDYLTGQGNLMEMEAYRGTSTGRKTAQEARSPEGRIDPGALLPGRLLPGREGPVGHRARVAPGRCRKLVRQR